jgi:hypothetical protein
MALTLCEIPCVGQRLPCEAAVGCPGQSTEASCVNNVCIERVDRQNNGPLRLYFHRNCAQWAGLLENSTIALSTSFRPT